MITERGRRDGLLSGTAVARGWTLLLLLAAVGGCSDWAGVQDVEFDDPYIQQLDTESGGWFGRTALFRRYAAVDRAFRLEADGELAEAASEVAGYLDRHPDDIRVRAYYLGLLSRLDRHEAVIEQASRILESEPTFVPALLARGNARAETGRLDGAVEDLVAASRAPSVRPEDRADALDAAARHALARAARLEDDGRPQEAGEAYAGALALPLDRDQRIRALRGRSRTAAARGRLEAARTAVEAAVDAAPSNAAVRRDAAGLAMTADDFAAAAAHLEVALESDGLSPAGRKDALDQLAVAYERMGRPAAAAASVEQLIRLQAGGSGAVELHVRAAELFSSAGRPTRAAVHLEAAAERTAPPRRTALLRRAARQYEAAGEYRSAVSVLRAALESSPDHAGVRTQLSRVLVLAGEAGRDIDALDGPARDARGDTLTGRELTASRRSFAAAYESTGRVQEAIELYALIADAEPAGSAAWIDAMERLAALHARRGDDRASADRLMALHRAATDRAEHHDGRWVLQAAERYAAVRAWDETAAAYREARALGALPGSDGARRLGIVLVEAGAPREAEEAFATIPPEDRTYRDLRYLAALAREAGDTDRAARLYDRALQRAPTASDSAATLRSIGYLHLGENDAAAAAALSRAVSIESDPDVRMDLARAQLRLGRADAALRSLEPPAGAEPAGERRLDRLDRLDLLAEVHAERGDTAAVIRVLERAAALDPSAYRLNRLGFFHELTGSYDRAAVAFERAYEARPSAMQAAQVAYARRRVGDDIEATAWFRRSIDDARDRPQASDTALDLDAMRREVAALTDRLSAAAYVSLRGEGGAAAPGVPQAGIGSQGGLQLQYRPMARRVDWGDDLDLFARLFWGFGDGVSIDPDSYQGQLGIRYRPPFLPGSALGVERWIGLGSAALDTWAVRLQLSRLLGRPYPSPGDGATAYASLYGDATYLLGSSGGSVLFGEARPGVAVPLGARVALLPHATVSAYHQSLAGVDQAYLEGGPGVGLRLRLPRESRYAKDYWAIELMAQYRWGRFFGSRAPTDDRYDELVLTLVLQL